MTPVEANAHVGQAMTAYFPLGVFKDAAAD